MIANFNFHGKGKVQPKGYKGLGIDDEVTVITKGKVKQIGSSWDDGATFAVEVSSCTIECPTESPVSLDAAVANSAKMRKRMM